jgi:hypothetical protein
MAPGVLLRVRVSARVLAGAATRGAVLESNTKQKDEMWRTVGPGNDAAVERDMDVATLWAPWASVESRRWAATSHTAPLGGCGAGVRLGRVKSQS